MGLTSVKNDYM